MKKDYKLYLDDILESINKIERYTKELNIEEFEKDEKSIDAVIKNLVNMSESARKIPISIQRLSPYVPWEEMAGMRKKLFHTYFVIKPDVIWNTIKKLPYIDESIEKLMQKLD